MSLNSLGGSTLQCYQGCRTLGLNQIKPVKSGKNQNAGIVGWYEKFLFTAAAVYYLERANVPHISHESLFPINKLHVLYRRKQKTVIPM